MMKKFVVLMLLAGLITAIDDANAGAWTQKRGRSSYELKFYFIRANQFYKHLTLNRQIGDRTGFVYFQWDYCFSV